MIYFSMDDIISLNGSGWSEFVTKIQIEDNDMSQCINRVPQRLDMFGIQNYQKKHPQNNHLFELENTLDKRGQLTLS